MTPEQHIKKAWNDMRKRNGLPALASRSGYDTIAKKLNTKFVEPGIASPEFLARFYEKNRFLANSSCGLSLNGAGSKAYGEDLMNLHEEGLAYSSAECVEKTAPAPDNGFAAYNLSMLEQFFDFLKKFAAKKNSMHYPVSSPCSADPSWLRLAAGRMCAELSLAPLEEAENAAEKFGAEAWEDYTYDPAIRKAVDAWPLTPEQCYGWRRFPDPPNPSAADDADDGYANRPLPAPADSSGFDSNLMGDPSSPGLPPPPPPPPSRKH